MKPLTIFFSMSGTTKRAAESIQKQVGGDLVEINPLNPYPANYESYAAVAKSEFDHQIIPEIKNSISNFKDYDTIFIGFPTWYQQPPMIIHRLLQMNFSNKKIIPFTTSMSTDIDSSTAIIRKLMSNSSSIVEDGFRYTTQDLKIQLQKYI
jgi:flavodoxin